MTIYRYQNQPVRADPVTPHTPPPVMPTPARNLCLEDFVQFQSSCSQKNASLDASRKHYSRTALLIHISMWMKRAATLFTSYSTLLTTAVFCSPYFFMSSSLVFCSKSFLSCNELLFQLLNWCYHFFQNNFFFIYFPFEIFLRSWRSSLSVVHFITLSAVTFALREGEFLSILSTSFLESCLVSVLRIRTETAASSDKCTNPGCTNGLKPDESVLAVKGSLTSSYTIQAAPRIPHSIRLAQPRPQPL